MAAGLPSAPVTRDSPKAVDPSAISKQQYFEKQMHSRNRDLTTGTLQKETNDADYEVQISDEEEDEHIFSVTRKVSLTLNQQLIK